MNNHYGIDVETHDSLKLIRRLKRLKTTISIKDGGRYYQDPSYCQVHLITTWNEEQLDNWLYLYSNCDYVGVFKMDSTDNE